jgi:hypothetical protein
LKPRRTFIELPDGTYRLEQELERAMNPPQARPPYVKLALIEAGYLLATAIVGLAVLIGVIVFCGFVAVFGVIRKIWRAWHVKT